MQQEIIVKKIWRDTGVSKKGRQYKKVKLLSTESRYFTTFKPSSITDALIEGARVILEAEPSEILNSFNITKIISYEMPSANPSPDTVPKPATSLGRFNSGQAVKPKVESGDVTESSNQLTPQAMLPDAMTIKNLSEYMKEAKLILADEYKCDPEESGLKWLLIKVSGKTHTLQRWDESEPKNNQKV